MTEKVGIIIQARMGSERLPGKVLFGMPYDSPKTMLDQIIERSMSVKEVDSVIVASTTESIDDAIANHLSGSQTIVFRGDEQNVLGRYYEAAKANQLDHVVRLTADNPCIDSNIIEETVSYHLENGSDYTVTTGLPLGTNIEILNWHSLQTAFSTAKLQSEKEHVTPYIKNNPGLFSVKELAYDRYLSIGDLRLTVDTTSDYALSCLLYRDLSNESGAFDLDDISKYYQSNSWIRYINSHVEQRLVL